MAVRSRWPWPWRVGAWASLLAIVAGMWWWGFDFGQFFGGFNRQELEARVSAAEAENERLKKDNAVLRSKAMQQETELAMASGAQATLSKQTQELAAENAQIKDELAFLQQLVADSNKQVGLSIQRLTVERETDDTWRYRFLLVRGGTPKDEFTGHATIQVTLQPATDTVPARSSTISLPEDQPGTEAALILKFKYYQRVEGIVAVPAGAAIRAVTVRAFESGQAPPRATGNLVIP